MAKWGKIGSRGKVIDRRGSPVSMAGLGGLGGVGLLIYLAVFILGGGSGSDVINQLDQLQDTTNVQQSAEFKGEDDYEQFASAVLGSNNAVWSSLFENNSYSEPTLVLFRQGTKSACGFASSSVGPHYCPLDQTIYLDETFFDVMVERFDAKGGDVAEAYVIAHEVGHHVQNELGILDDVNQLRENRDEKARQAAIDLELQADCFAGIWAYSIKDQGIFGPNEINEAIDAAAAVGDDRIQEKVEGQINPETWTHGSSEQRKKWFKRGYNSGSPQECNTFS